MFNDWWIYFPNQYNTVLFRRLNQIETKHALGTKLIRGRTKWLFSRMVEVRTRDSNVLRGLFSRSVNHKTTGYVCSNTMLFSYVVHYNWNIVVWNWSNTINIFSALRILMVWWKHFPRYCPFLRGIHRWPVNSPHKGQLRGALMFSWINGWVNNRKAGDLRHHHAHYDVTVMMALSINRHWPR